MSERERTTKNKQGGDFQINKDEKFITASYKFNKTELNIFRI